MRVGLDPATIAACKSKLGTLSSCSSIGKDSSMNKYRTSCRVAGRRASGDVADAAECRINRGEALRRNIVR